MLNNLTPGVRQMLLSTLLFAGMNACVKQLHHLPALEIIFFRSIFSIVASYVALRRLGVAPFGNNHRLLISRGSTGALALICYFLALQNLPLATAVTVQYLAPIFATVLGIWLVREPVLGWQWVFFGLSFGGVLLVQQGGTAVAHVAQAAPGAGLLYLGIGVVGALVSGLSYNAIRKLRGREHPLVIVFYFPLISLPIAAVACLFNWQTPHGTDWLWLLACGAFTQGAQLTMTRAYQLERLSRVAPLNYLGMFYALGLGYLFFAETFGPLAYAGMALVLLGVGLNAWYAARADARAAALPPLAEEVVV
ncbi:membrane protein [Hymenobacter frigidus]|jgi:drug/metabolite transporter (DMT)-like permease|uniref:Membrane protein n=1 Tax=Hymenobacter frigidus TaxID=1524095 RepID=A0ABQ2ACA2_9BACT|nr:DMT family transporter [Hymenobacter frigidus]GGH88447.1 membrane protein [Hymenobacter frigidus]